MVDDRNAGSYYFMYFFRNFIYCFRVEENRRNTCTMKLKRVHLTHKGMETWQLVLIILALIVLVLVVIWYSGLNESIRDLLDKMMGGF